MKDMRWVAALCLALAAEGAAGQDAASGVKKIKITVSKETTLFTEPLNADGTVNYVAALNAVLGKGVTPENNAAIPLIRALGPRSLGEKTRDLLLSALKMEPLPAEGIYFKGPFWFCGETYPDSPRGRERLTASRDASRKGPVQAADHPELAAWVQANREPLAAVKAATNKPRYFVPWVSTETPPSMEDGLLRGPGLRLTEVGNALVARAMLRAGAGDIDAARADLRTARRLGKLQVREKGTAPGFLAGLAPIRFACQAQRGLAAQGNLSAKDARAFLADLPLPGDVPPLSEWDGTVERVFSLDYWMKVARVGLDKGFALPFPIPGREVVEVPDVELDWDEVLRAENELSGWLARINAKPFPGRAKAFEDFARELLNTSPLMKRVPRAGLMHREVLKLILGEMKSADRKELSRAVVVGLAVSGMHIPERIGEVFVGVRMEFDLTRVALALAAYRAEKEEYPAALTKLVPGYLPALPEDLFTCKPLRYRRVGNGYVLYSAGPNMKDDGGRKSDTGEGPDDIVVRAE